MDFVRPFSGNTFKGTDVNQIRHNYKWRLDLELILHLLQLDL